MIEVIDECRIGDANKALQVVMTWMYDGDLIISLKDAGNDLGAWVLNQEEINLLRSFLERERRYD